MAVTNIKHKFKYDVLTVCRML